MYLLNAITKRYLIITTTILILGGIVFFFILQYILDEQLNEQLYEEKAKLQEEFSNSPKLPDHFQIPGLLLTKTNSAAAESLNDTLIFSEAEQEFEPYRMLSFPLENNNFLYRISISKALYEKSDLIITIIWLLVSIMVIQFCFLWFVSKYFNSRLFAPFFETLSVMDNYAPGKTESVNLKPAKVKEFERLNNSFASMHKRLLNEFRELKDFTENASHELQTPLAILQNNIHMLMQENNLTTAQILMLDEMSDSVMRLSKMNKQLLLLTKIENNQFKETTAIFMNAIVEMKAAAMKEFFEHKQLEFRFVQESLLQVSMNSILADILMNNLFSNAIKYASEGTTVIVTITAESLEITNTGMAKALESEKMFSRFYKVEGSSDSTGLGLAIVKQICDLYHFIISYRYADTTHSFCIRFSTDRFN